LKKYNNLLDTSAGLISTKLFGIVVSLREDV